MHGPIWRRGDRSIPARAALDALALFVSKGQIDTEGAVDAVTGKVRGDPRRGRAIFQNVCAICHDYDGMAWIAGDNDELINLGARRRPR